MWITRVRIKHDCIIGNRCEKFNVKTLGSAYGVFIKNGVTYSPQIHTVYGDSKSKEAFLEDLEKDNRVEYFEREHDTFFLLEVRKEKIPATFYHNQLLYVRPNFVDNDGCEYWSLSSWKRQHINEFVRQIKSNFKDSKVLMVKEIKLTDLYYPHLAPKLTESQKRALELALENGYYQWPRKIDLGKLAKLMKVSIPTYREHLKRAESKVMPDLLNSLKNKEPQM